MAPERLGGHGRLLYACGHVAAQCRCLAGHAQAPQQLAQTCPACRRCTHCGGQILGHLVEPRPGHAELELACLQCSRPLAAAAPGARPPRPVGEGYP